MWVRKRFHIGFTDLFHGLLSSLPTLGQGTRETLLRDLEDIWAGDVDKNPARPYPFACFSVRTAFDLFLQAHRIPQGSEVILSAITIPDMVQIIEKHGLVPIPVDIDTSSMIPKAHLLAKARSVRTKLLLATHLFGIRHDLGSFIRFAREHDLLVAEDCAQSFSGADGYRGHPDADISMFSFGSIKHASALGGALCRVKDKKILDRMRELEASYPIQKRTQYALKIVLYCLLKGVSVSNLLYALLVGILKAAGRDHDGAVTRWTRAFNNSDLLPALRQRPSEPLLRLLVRRMRQQDHNHWEVTIRKGKLADRQLGGHVQRPGIHSSSNTYWLYPVAAKNPGTLIFLLRQNGFDATCGAAQLTWVTTPDGMDPGRARELDPREARKLLMNIVYLPVYPEMPDSEIERMAAICVQHARPLEKPGIGLAWNPGVCSGPKNLREIKLEALSRHEFDLLVVGGGINGAGIARDAALRGMSVALVEQHDYASGASGNSAKLIHGGYRYLESLQFGLVAECCAARDLQLKLNGSMIEAIPFLVPLRGNRRLQHAWLRTGLWAYDICGRFRNYKRHSRISIESTATLAPGIDTTDLHGSLLYFDCRVDDARLTILNITDAERNGAVAVNHVKFLEPILNGDKGVGGALVLDRETGLYIRVAAKQLVIAAGAAADRYARLPQKVLSPTKGIHIAMAREKLPLRAAVILTSPDDGRWCYAIPFFESVIVGTTETPHQADGAETLEVSRSDVIYLLRAVQHQFPALRIHECDIHATWAGLRPLRNLKLGSNLASRILSDMRLAWINRSNLGPQIRDYSVQPDEMGILFAFGGKLTTFRNLSQMVVDEIEARRPHPESRRIDKSLSAELPLDPGIITHQARIRSLIPDENLRRHLVGRYGSGALWIHARMKTHPQEAERIIGSMEFRYAEVTWALMAESACRLEDVLVRRLGIYHRDMHQGLGCCEKVAAHMADILGEDGKWTRNELHRYASLVARSRAWMTEPQDALTEVPK